MLTLSDNSHALQDSDVERVRPVPRPPSSGDAQLLDELERVIATLIRLIV